MRFGVPVVDPSSYISISERSDRRKKMGKSSIKRADKREGIKPGAHSMNPDRKVANQSKGKLEV
jgi:hypothetical protein